MHSKLMKMIWFEMYSKEASSKLFPNKKLKFAAFTGQFCTISSKHPRDVCELNMESFWPRKYLRTHIRSPLSGGRENKQILFCIKFTRTAHWIANMDCTCAAYFILSSYLFVNILSGSGCCPIPVCISGSVCRHKACWHPQKRRWCSFERELSVAVGF